MEQVTLFFTTATIHVVRYFLMAGLPFFIFYKKYNHYFDTNKIQQRIARNKDLLREILHSMQTILVMGGLSVLLLATPLKIYSKIYMSVSAYPIWWLPISLLIVLIIQDTYFYWVHRLVHHPKLFKRVHLVHHKSTNPTPFAAYSFHFIEAILESFIAPILLFCLPLHPIVIVLYGAITFSLNVYGHLGFEIVPKWFRKSWLFEVLNTSVHHNLHHSKFHGNYGLFFRTWDRIMKTEHPDYVKEFDKIQAQRFG